MTNNYDLGKIETVELRKIWPHEALDFTKWLAEDENLQLLGDTIGTELELIEVESSVGSFNVDIFANEVGTSRKVIIENQLEDTNHDHLGKIITYASGKDAEIIVWIVARARDEHRQAIEWLNQHTDNNFGFFLIEIQLWKIGDSKAAPRFHIIEQPNEWTKMVKLSAELTETERAKLSYWTQYNEIAKCNPEFMQLFSPQKPSKDHWTTLRSIRRRSVLGLSFTFLTTRRSAIVPLLSRSNLRNIYALRQDPLMLKKLRDYASIRVVTI